MITTQIMAARPLAHEDAWQREETSGRIAWWFCQGYFRKQNGPPTNFVICFFHGYDFDENDKSHNYLFIALTEPGLPEQRLTCRVDQVFIDTFHKELASGKINLGILDRFMAEAILKEATEYGLPGHFELAASPSIDNTSGWHIQWDHFQLTWKDRRIELHFKEPKAQGQIHFELSSENPALDLTTMDIPRLENTSYITFPRMKLRGLMGGETITGQAWFDYQDTDPSEIVLEKFGKQSRLIGWEWFAFNFEDGSDWLLQQYRDMNTKEVLDKYAVIVQPGKPALVIRDFVAEPLSYWVSPFRHIRYPIAWRIHIPQQAAEIEFFPDSPDREIPMIGYMRAVWEGDGEVKGNWQQGEIKGRGHVELSGYGYIFDFKQYTKVFVERVDALIEDFFPRQLDENSLEGFVGRPVWQHDPETLTEALSAPVWDLLDRGGKHWRPMLGLFLLETLGVPTEPYEALLANVIELNHTGALIIDDIEDESLIRRGEECVHLRYGTDVAINAGTVLYFIPYLILTKDLGLTEGQLVELYRIVISFQIKAHFGQGMDIAWTKKMSGKWLRNKIRNGFSKQILEMYSMKTGAATQGTAEAACVIAGAESPVRKAYSDFGRIFGVSFQIVDDVLNFTGSLHWTKRKGEDLEAGKPTWIIVRALELLKTEDQERLIAILCDPEARNDPLSLKDGVSLVAKSGALEQGRRLARKMLEQEWRNFSLYAPPSEAKTMLRMLVTGLLSFDEDY